MLARRRRQPTARWPRASQVPFGLHTFSHSVWPTCLRLPELPRCRAGTLLGQRNEIGGSGRMTESSPRNCRPSRSGARPCGMPRRTSGSSASSRTAASSPSAALLAGSPGTGPDSPCRSPASSLLAASLLGARRDGLSHLPRSVTAAAEPRAEAGARDAGEAGWGAAAASGLCAASADAGSLPAGPGSAGSSRSGWDAAAAAIPGDVPPNGDPGIPDLLGGVGEAGWDVLMAAACRASDCGGDGARSGLAAADAGSDAEPGLLCAPLGGRLADGAAGDGAAALGTAPATACLKAETGHLWLPQAGLGAVGEAALEPGRAPASSGGAQPAPLWPSRAEAHGTAALEPGGAPAEAGAPPGAGGACAPRKRGRPRRYDVGLLLQGARCALNS